MQKNASKSARHILEYKQCNDVFLIASLYTKIKKILLKMNTKKSHTGIFNPKFTKCDAKNISVIAMMQLPKDQIAIW